MARMVASADLTLRGTYDQPGDIRPRRNRTRRGDVRRPPLPHHARVDGLHEPDRASSRSSISRPRPTCACRARPTASRSGWPGTSERLRPTLNSDPPLPTADVLALLFGDARRDSDAGARVARAAGPEPGADRHPRRRAPPRRSPAPISAEVGSVVEQTFGVNTFQLTPSFVDPYSTSRRRAINPTARVTIGKRISDRVYLTFSRSLEHDDQRSDHPARDRSRATGCRGCCRGTRISRPTRSNSA